MLVATYALSPLAAGTAVVVGDSIRRYKEQRRAEAAAGRAPGARPRPRAWSLAGPGSAAAAAAVAATADSDAGRAARFFGGAAYATPAWWSLWVLLSHRTAKNYRNVGFILPRTCDKLGYATILMALYWGAGECRPRAAPCLLRGAAPTCARREPRSKTRAQRAILPHTRMHTRMDTHLAPSPQARTSPWPTSPMWRACYTS
jgi:hypothetical protein